MKREHFEDARQIIDKIEAAERGIRNLDTTINRLQEFVEKVEGNWNGSEEWMANEFAYFMKFPGVRTRLLIMFISTLRAQRFHNRKKIYKLEKRLEKL